MCIKTKKLALKIIMWTSVAGMAFSGYLSYFELFRKVCPVGGGCSNLLGLPVCVYGLGMYIAVFVISLLGLKAKK